MLVFDPTIENINISESEMGMLKFGPYRVTLSETVFS